MRVIAGQEGGRSLKRFRDDGIRPTSARVRSSMFAMLEARLVFDGITVLDLFAGTGALGIESLSRGASHATFVDDSERSLQVVRRNLHHLALSKVGKTHKSDALRYLERNSKVGPIDVDLVFCDPPYEFDRWSELFALLPTTPIVVVESSRAIALPDAWIPMKEKAYGDTYVAIVCHRESRWEARTDS